MSLIFRYLGRKPQADDLACDDCKLLSRPGYSYWTVAYMLTAEGAKKLLNTKVLSQMIPVDEYIPMMFDQNPGINLTS